jgi:uncharacterized membrane protein HdeD (DUF308 family)
MRAFKELYYVISYSLVIAQIGFISILLYNRMIRDRVLYYGNTDNPSEISENYFEFLRFLMYATFAMMIVWAVLTPFVIISNRRSTQKDHIHIVPGLLGFIVAFILLVTDPFGMFKWFTN